jgi:hypothetical protein
MLDGGRRLHELLSSEGLLLAVSELLATAEQIVGRSMTKKSRLSSSFTQRPFSLRPPDKPIPIAIGFLRRQHHRMLLEISKELLRQKYYGAALVIAQTACEVFVEVAIATILKSKGLESLDQSLKDFVQNYNLANQRNRKLYVALSEDNIQRESFWNKYVTMVKLRHDVVHKGKQVTAQEGKDSFEVANEMIEHLEAVLEAKYPRSTWIWRSP